MPSWLDLAWAGTPMPRCGAVPVEPTVGRSIQDVRHSTEAVEAGALA